LTEPPPRRKREECVCILFALPSAQPNKPSAHTQRGGLCPGPRGDFFKTGALERALFVDMTSLKSIELEKFHLSFCGAQEFLKRGAREFYAARADKDNMGTMRINPIVRAIARPISRGACTARYRTRSICVSVASVSKTMLRRAPRVFIDCECASREFWSN
jgi:hypothetical protein